MEQSITPENVYAFAKLLVELNGMYFVDKDLVIRQTDGDTPVGVKCGNSAKTISLFKEGMQINPNSVILNPFTETLAKSPERDWFFNYISILPGALIKYTITQIVEDATSKKKDVNYEAMSVITEHLDNMDAKMLDEIDRIKTSQWGIIFYDKADHVAQLQSDIFNVELEKSLKGKVRKSSWEVFRKLMVMLLGVEDIESKYTYTATILAVPKADAMLHVLVAAVAKMGSIVKKVLDTDLHPTLLKHHLENLETYQSLVHWFSTGTAQMEKKETKKEAALPWEKSSIPMGTGKVPVMGSASGVPLNGTAPGSLPMSEGNLLKQEGGVTPAGVPVNGSSPVTASMAPVMSSMPMSVGNLLTQNMIPVSTITKGTTPSGVPMHGSAPGFGNSL